VHQLTEVLSFAREMLKLSSGHAAKELLNDDFESCLECAAPGIRKPWNATDPDLHFPGNGTNPEEGRPDPAPAGGQILGWMS
jgi:hypothetical protein